MSSPHRHRVSILLSVAVVCGCAPVPPETAATNERLLELRLRSRVFDNTRTVRVLLPPSYGAGADRRYPVLYFTDGIAAFDAWGVREIAERLWAGGELAEMIVVGIDNGGSTDETTDPVRDRASEYLPYPDPTWSGSASAAPRGSRFPEFLFGEVKPLIDGRFRTRADPADTGLAGASYGGAAVLFTAMRFPDRIDFLLVESVPLHIGDDRLLQEALATERWPEVVSLGVGTAEGDDPEGRSRVVENMRALHDAVARTSPRTRVRLVVQESGVHWYDAWKERLPEALSFWRSARRGPSHTATSPYPDEPV